ncbi:hypothetical protein KC19_1G319200 [Ceratodon purpureus]|uniref:Maf-like protein n=1 Tax=Ceratodon purpureus TaxID=3225 RepID=A0A8T0JEK4_CERPU|nr:hypothetical protein KC19_1G319200 [Ceratodon purpureus]
MRLDLLVNYILLEIELGLSVGFAELQSQVLEKPFDKDDAYRMLSSLSGQKHKVYTGVALVLPNASDSAPGAPPLVKSFYEETEVEFAELEEEAILAYIASGEPMDKAGAYGIQGIGGSFVKCIHGCYFNIMGFPVHRYVVCSHVLLHLYTNIAEADNYSVCPY